MSGRPAPPPLSRALRLVALASACCFACGSAQADSDDIHGRLEIADAGTFSHGDSIEAALGDEDADDLLGNLRLTWEPSWDRWSVSFHYLVTMENGGDVPLVRAETILLPEPPSTWFDLTDTFYNHGQAIGTQGIDRLAFAYTAPDFVVRVGRQALTWGSGLVFHPMDLFDPFAPNATDTEYKPGTDMLYTQWLFGDGSDLQFIVVPRPPREGAAPSSDASSVALHLQTSLFDHDTTWLLARDHGDWVGAVGVNGAWAGSTWNLEFLPTRVDRGRTRVSALANISDAITLLDRNATVFAEYYHNGFGVSGNADYALSSLPPDLLDRLERGQLFDTRRDYLASGLTLEVDPLFTVSPTLIADLDDASLFALVAGTYSLGDNLNLIAGVQVPIGPAHTEFGGLPLAPGGSTFLASPAQIYIQLRRYF